MYEETIGTHPAAAIFRSRPESMEKASMAHPTTGAVEMDPYRTSTNVNIPQAEVPTIVAKILRLANCEAHQLDIFQFCTTAKVKNSMYRRMDFVGQLQLVGLRTLVDWSQYFGISMTSKKLENQDFRSLD